MEVQVLGHHGQIGEEVASGNEFFPGFLLQPAHLVADGVDGEGDEVEHQQHVGKALLAVSEVVFEVVSVVLEFVEGFVFDFPSASCAVKQLPDVVSRDRDGGDEVGFVGFASVAMDLQCHPVDAHRRISAIKISTIGFMAASYITINPTDQVSYLVVFIHLFFRMRIADAQYFASTFTEICSPSSVSCIGLAPVFVGRHWKSFKYSPHIFTDFFHGF